MYFSAFITVYFKLYSFYCSITSLFYIFMSLLAMYCFSPSCYFLFFFYKAHTYCLLFFIFSCHFLFNFIFPQKASPYFYFIVFSRVLLLICLFITVKLAENAAGTLTTCFCIINFPWSLCIPSQSYRLSNEAPRQEFEAMCHD